MSNWLFPGSPSLRDLTNKRVFANQWRNNGPIITECLVLICIVVWALEIITRFIFPQLFSIIASNGTLVPLLVPYRPWILVTSMFLHQPGIFHILFNMLALWSVGPVLERMMGHWQFLALYMLSGIGGNTFLALLGRIMNTQASWLSGAYGASGAIFGLFAALLVVYRRLGQDISSMIVLMAINFALPIIVPNIAWQAHVGGFIFGGLYVWLLTSGIPQLRQYSFAKRAWIYGIALAVVIVAALAWSFAMLY